MKVIRRLYDWVLGWAGSKWGTLALFVLAFFEASFFPVPPDVLLIALCLGAPKKSLRYALVCLAGSVSGAAAGYGLGLWVWDAVNGWFIPGLFSQEAFDSVGALYDEWNFWAVFVGAFTPIPYKVFTVAAGVFAINFPMFIFASLIGRGMRFFLIAWLIWRFGPPIKALIDKYFNLAVIIFTVLLVGGFLLIRYAF